MHFNNGAQIEIELVQGDVATNLTKIYKHLQHAPLNFKKWDSPFYLDHATLDELVNNLKMLGTLVGVDVDIEQCLPFDQAYYNQLHKTYELGYNGNPDWLDFHEHIHLCEAHHRNFNLRTVSIDYRERAGPLIKPFNNTYLSNIITDVTPGTVYVEWAELGKPVYTYWLDNEPNDPARICELAKPWLTFKPKLRIATQHTNLLSNVDPNFYDWWKQYESDWCRHWQLDAWPIEFIKGVIQVGTVLDLDAMINLFRQQMPLEKITLQ